MITGDHPQTSLVIAEELSITGKGDIAVSGIKIDKLSDNELQQLVPTVSVYARVNAEHKLRIVRAWKANGAIVAMTGDGVNDAPAIKLADIGIAMGKTGTEVTKEASDMIITDDNFASIVAAVEEGRGIYDNIKKTLQYLLAGNLGELLVVTSAVMTGLPVPLLPIHLLWINLVTDGIPALALATDPIDPDIMKQPPRRRTEQITDRSFFALMTFTGILTAAVTLSVYIYELRHATEEVAMTYAFATLVYAEVLRSFGARSTTKPIWEIKLFSNIKLSLVVALTMFFQPWSHHVPTLQYFFKIVPMPWSECFILIAIGLIPLVVLEIFKIVRRSFNRPATLLRHP
jgi:Ca2+-transporting ATPase